jgi:eukaryotic-like serine/threonine-protein kinase
LSLPKFTSWQLALAALLVGLVFSGWAIVHFLSTEQPRLISMDPVNRQSIDLLSQIQLPQSALLGNWKRSADGIESDASAPAKLQLPYAPIDDYDFRITFTRKSGDQPVMQLLSTNGKRIAWMMGGWQNSVSGFGMVDGASADQNASACQAVIVNGRKYTAEIRVRQHSVSAYLDGVLVSSLNTDDAKFTVPELLAISEGSLGLATHKSPTIFHSIEVIPRAK